MGRRQATGGNGNNDDDRSRYRELDDPRRRSFIFWSAAARHARTDDRGRAM